MESKGGLIQLGDGRQGGFDSWGAGPGGSVGMFMAVFPAIEGYVAGSKGLAHELVVSVRCKRRASHTWLRNAEG